MTYGKLTNIVAAMGGKHSFLLFVLLYLPVCAIYLLFLFFFFQITIDLALEMQAKTRLASTRITIKVIQDNRRLETLRSQKLPDKIRRRRSWMAIPFLKSKLKWGVFIPPSNPLLLQKKIKFFYVIKIFYVIKFFYVTIISCILVIYDVTCTLFVLRLISHNKT